MRPVLTAAAAAALIAALASPAVAAPENEAGTPSSNAAGTATSAIKVKSATAPSRGAGLSIAAGAKVGYRKRGVTAELGGTNGRPGRSSVEMRNLCTTT